MAYKETLLLSNVENEEQFNSIVKSINAMYQKDKPFWMSIETQNVRNVHLKYMYKIGKYLNNVRTKYPKLLQYSYINVYNDLVFDLLYTLFTFVSKPIAKVTVIYYEGGYVSTPTREMNKIKKMKEYYPKDMKVS